MERFEFCPQCAETLNSHHDALIEQVESQYGIVDRQMYLNYVEALDRWVKENEPKETMRVKYEVWFLDYKMNVRVSCMCSVCGFEFDYSEKVDMQ